MPHQLPALPYDLAALEPHISVETFEYHWGKHHAAYVNNLNKLVSEQNLSDKSLEDLITTKEGAVFNNAAQHFNHSFFWQCLSPGGGGEPQGVIKTALEASFGSVAAFREQFTQKAVTLFGSGWVWLAQNQDGSLFINQAANAGTPLRDGLTPVLTCDVWEHAYYIDYRNARPKYVERFWEIVNWEFAAAQLKTQ